MATSQMISADTRMDTNHFFAVMCRSSSSHYRFLSGWPLAAVILGTLSADTRMNEEPRLYLAISVVTIAFSFAVLLGTYLLAKRQSLSFGFLMIFYPYSKGIFFADYAGCFLGASFTIMQGYTARRGTDFPAISSQKFWLKYSFIANTSHLPVFLSYRHFLYKIITKNFL